MFFLPYVLIYHKIWTLSVLTIPYEILEVWTKAKLWGLLKTTEGFQKILFSKGVLFHEDNK